MDQTGSDRTSGGSRRRRPRLRVEELRKRMFDAARQTIRQRGVVLSFEDLNMDEVIARAQVPRSSVYRVWPYKGDFVNDLLMNFAGPEWLGPANIQDSPLELALRAILDGWDSLSTDAGRIAVLNSAVRVGVGAHFRGIVASREWYVARSLALTSQAAHAEDPGRAQLNAELERADNAFISSVARLYEVVAYVLGFRLRDPSLTFEHMALAGGAILDGLALRAILTEANASNPFLTEPSILPHLIWDSFTNPVTGQKDWDLPGLGHLALIMLGVELIPDWQPAPELKAHIEALMPGPADAEQHQQPTTAPQ